MHAEPRRAHAGIEGADAPRGARMQDAVQAGQEPDALDEEPRLTGSLAPNAARRARRRMRSAIAGA
jgi:hypothetical protein